MGRKVALIGGEPATVIHAPWDDPSWEIWAHASIGRWCQRVDRWFELHPPAVFQEASKHGRKDWYGWLKSRPEPIYMQERYPDIPTSVRYPKERVLTEFPRYLSSTVAWMVALALIEGVQTIGLWGIHLQAGTEYFEQRANAEFWLGMAMGRGVQIKMPEACPLLKRPHDLYGYESHTPEKYAKRKADFLARSQQVISDHFKHTVLRPMTREDILRVLATGPFPKHDNTLKRLLAKAAAA